MLVETTDRMRCCKFPISLAGKCTILIQIDFNKIVFPTTADILVQTGSVMALIVSYFLLPQTTAQLWG
jgi:hypothetical protein